MSCCNIPCDVIIIDEFEDIKIDEDGLEYVSNCEWREVERFRCSRSYTPSAKSYSQLKQEKISGIEHNINHRYFWVQIGKQAKNSNFRLKRGDMLIYCNELFKIIDIKPYTHLGCRFIEILGEQNSQRGESSDFIFWDGVEQDIKSLTKGLRKSGY